MCPKLTLKIILLILTIVIIYLITLIIIFSRPIFISVMRLFILRICTGVSVGLIELECWVRYLVLITLAGGMIISIVYIVRLCPNFKPISDWTRWLTVFTLLLFTSEERRESTTYLNFQILELCVVLRVTLFTLLFILLFMDAIISYLKGSLRLKI